MTPLALVCLIAVQSISGEQTVEVPLAGGKAIVFLAGPEARDAITEDEHDPFFRSLSRIDAELRLGEPLDGVPAARRIRLLKRQYRGAVSDWTEPEIAVVTAACREVFAAAEPITDRFVPGRWKFVKTDGAEEAGAAYTRYDAIVLPQQKLDPFLNRSRPRGRLARLVAHETAHVFSRSNPRLRDRLYERLGFRHVGPIEVNRELADRRITNPDGPTTEHVIRIRDPRHGAFDAALFLYAKSDRYKPALGRRLFDYLRVGLFPVERTDDGYRIQATEGLDPRSAGGFFDQVGRNTDYIIHPDEILAENLAILLTRGLPGATRRPPADERLLRDLAAILAE